MAILDACTQINKNLDPYREPGKSWEDTVMSAYFERESLSAFGHYKTPDLTYDWDTNTGRMYNYFTYGAACTEVEIDVLTGDHSVLRSDLVMDIGTSINPTIDVGQVNKCKRSSKAPCRLKGRLSKARDGGLPSLY